MRLLPSAALLGTLLLAPGAAFAQTDRELGELFTQGDYAALEEIAKKGDVRAEPWMALLLQGQGKRAEAKELWQRAAQRNDRWAIQNLAAMHLSDQEFTEAVRWYRRGAELGDPNAQLTLGWWHVQGQYVQKDEEEAARLFAAAANAGHKDAYLALAELYSTGRGVKQDIKEAYAMAAAAENVLDPSEAHTVARAKELKEQLADRLTPAETQAAIEKAHKMAPKPQTWFSPGALLLISTLGASVALLLGVLLGKRLFNRSRRFQLMG